MKKTVQTALLAIFCLNLSYAQISISSANYNTVSMNETNIVQAIIMNSGSSIQVTATVSCKNANGDELIEGTLKPFTLTQGMNSVSGLAIGFSNFRYGNSNQALYLKSNGLLPSGNFVYCLRINAASNHEDGDLYCEDFSSATDDFLSLVVPYDGDTLDFKQPVLTWTHSEPFNALARNEYYKIIVAEIRAQQSPEQAVFANPSVFTKSFLNAHSVPYPIDAKELEEGKSYAWQVQKISNNTIVNKTDTWKFTIPRKKEVYDVKYAVMKQDYDAAYYTANNERIFFQFEEPYFGNKLDCKIFNPAHKEMKAEINNEKVKKSAQTEEVIKSRGNNQYELDLSHYRLKQGYYFLEVFNEKNRKAVLKFYFPGS